MEKILVAIAVKLAPLIAAKLLEYLPLIGGVLVKAFLDELKKRSDIDLPDIPLPPVVQDARKTLNEIIPDVDFGNPIVDSLLDAWRPKP